MKLVLPLKILVSMLSVIISIYFLIFLFIVLIKLPDNISAYLSLYSHARSIYSLPLPHNTSVVGKSANFREGRSMCTSIVTLVVKTPLNYRELIDYYENKIPKTIVSIDTREEEQTAYIYFENGADGYCNL